MSTYYFLTTMTLRNVPLDQILGPPLKNQMSSISYCDDQGGFPQPSQLCFWLFLENTTQTFSSTALASADTSQEDEPYRNLAIVTQLLGPMCVLSHDLQGLRVPR